ncbi:MAG TPA: hypothetical protein VFG25_03650 [Nitrosopumilaceae archaeon]|nr:hypothetical protein [Nitrosopumilaceae archaeon]
MNQNETSKKAKELVAEYKKLLKEAEHSAGLDEEKLPRQLEEVRNEYKKLTGNDIDQA